MCDVSAIVVEETDSPRHGTVYGTRNKQSCAIRGVKAVLLVPHEQHPKHPKYGRDESLAALR